jgi:hypothetical protein
MARKKNRQTKTKRPAISTMPAPSYSGTVSLSTSVLDQPSTWYTGSDDVGDNNWQRFIDDVYGDEDNETPRIK